MSLIQEVEPTADTAETYENTRWSGWDTLAGLTVILLSYGVPAALLWWIFR